MTKLLVIGGDLRITKMAESFASSGYEVSAIAISPDCDASKIKIFPALNGALHENDIIVLGLPCSLDDKTINTPFCSDKLSFIDLFKLMNKSQILVGGLISENILNLAKMYDIRCVDYFKREELEVLNAIPTAEGAIEIAMQELPITIHGSNCLVVGYGRIGKTLSRLLYSLGANVTASARSYSDLAWIVSMGYTAVQTEEIANYIDKMDVVFNTVPFHVITFKELERAKPNCLFIDIASKPGGIDLEAAKQLNRSVIWALSLPGKVAPVTAGEIIKTTIINILRELGVEQ